METLGERIKKLRKEKGLTLQTLAGDVMTKGMLSLIENNKAKPSMESLAYIAGQLGVHSNELLEEVPTTELRELLQEVETLYKADLYQPDDFKAIVDKIEPYAEKLPYRYESARLLEIYSRCRYYAKLPDWQLVLERAEAMYEGLHLVNNSADVHMFRAMVTFQQHEYTEALKMLQDSRRSFEERDAVIDSLKKLDFDFLEAILYFAVGEDAEALRVLKEGIDYSRERQIYYKINDLYRVMSFHAMLSNDIERKDYYVGKLRLFAEFSEDEIIETTLDLLEAHYLVSFVHEYEKAEKIIDINLEKYKDEDNFQFYMEKGKALYGQGKLDEALFWLKKHQIYEHLHHPYDLSMNYEKDAYLALIYEQQGQHDLAVKHAAIAKENIEPMLDLPYKKFILDVYAQIVQ
ncbi:helix-turn-helix domain-containing protein [Planomicrobium chinense]|uniref:helix-turn-helix domain-containing protein n=1 Tax=Planococcus chinensis TaxID=272917 RepID=UPI001CC56EA2|nr:helix-turn-helix transcriptional regulator [Planococcus chinensis]MBZ5201035.1 helix-turn-helix domain-containing protein [Planococcus chinensis]MCP2036036.1 transcriptional regulator with XRE-family HTH domain/ATP/maltotriose-dependent transcriptional regulator MalT [Planomicrobium sp. HSC-17F08]